MGLRRKWAEPVRLGLGSRLDAVEVDFGASGRLVAEVPWLLGESRGLQPAGDTLEVARLLREAAGGNGGLSWEVGPETLTGILDRFRSSLEERGWHLVAWDTVLRESWGPPSRR